MSVQHVELQLAVLHTAVDLGNESASRTQYKHMSWHVPVGSEIGKTFGTGFTSSLGSSSASPSAIHWGCPVRAGNRNPGRAARGCLSTPGATSPSSGPSCLLFLKAAVVCSAIPVWCLKIRHSPLKADCGNCSCQSRQQWSDTMHLCLYHNACIAL